MVEHDIIWCYMILQGSKAVISCWAIIQSLCCVLQDAPKTYKGLWSCKKYNGSISNAEQIKENYFGANLAAIFVFCSNLNSSASVRGRPAIVVPTLTFSWVRKKRKNAQLRKNTSKPSWPPAWLKFSNFA